MSCHRAGNVVEICRPTATGLELVGGFVEGRVTGGTGVDASGRHVLVIFSGEGGFGALLAKDAELFFYVSASRLRNGERGDIPFERTACHSSSDFWTG
jgi:hypothetical protein